MAPPADDRTREGVAVDAEMMALASSAGSALVAALATDLWERAQSSVGALGGAHIRSAQPPWGGRGTGG
ncbi:hypothetical protein, partial [Streptomyces sp. HG99]|uniref:hypothetical protein n=1 Tax=Streptomyces sp. HG99 TaxID=1958787 RepID=UPI0035A1C4F0